MSNSQRTCCRSSLTYVSTVCFLAIVPLERLFEYGGEQMSFYCGSDLGDLITISLNKYVPLFRPSRLVSSADYIPLQHSRSNFGHYTYDKMRVSIVKIICSLERSDSRLRLKLLQSTIIGRLLPCYRTFSVRLTSRKVSSFFIFS